MMQNHNQDNVEYKSMPDYSASEENIDSGPNSGDSDIGSGKDGLVKAKEHTRSTMALLFVLGFFAVLFLCFVYAIAVKASLTELKETLVAIIGALSGLIGFIVGYYYKSSQE